MTRGEWGIRVDTKDWACLVTWTTDPMAAVWANLAPSSHAGPLHFKPDEAIEIGQALMNAGRNAKEGLTPADSVR
jgi:hypothetical protein